jgi:hypothetical protein
MMTTTTRFTAGLLLALALTACSGSAPIAPAPTPTPPTVTAPIGSDPTAVPIGSAPTGPGAEPGGLVPGGPADGGSGSGSGSGTAPGGNGGGGNGGSAPGDPGTGVVTSPPDGDGGGIVPDPPGTLVTPVAGLLNLRQIGATKLEPALNGNDVAVRISWVSGVEPCSVLAGVNVARDGNTFKLTITEGSKGEGMACIEIAMFKATIVDLGKVDPGTYTITAYGDAPAATVEVK